MTSMDLHPDDLLDREMRGDLSPGERDRLDAHLRQCAVCRLERLARQDFQKEREDDSEADVFARRLVAALIVPPALQDDLRRPARPRMRHLRLALVAAAVLTVAGWAGAARWVGAGRFVSVLSLHRSETPSPAEAVRTPRRGPPTNDPPAVAPSDSIEAPVASTTVPEANATAPSRPSALRTSTFAAPVRARSRDVGVGGAATVPDPSPVFESPPAPPPDAPALFRRATDARRAGDHPRATHLYRALIEDYPSSSEAAVALAVLGRLLLDDADAEGALRCFDQYLRRGGASREDVMLGRALSLERLGRIAEEARAWNDLVSEYPSSVHAQRAQRRLLELGSH